MDVRFAPAAEHWPDWNARALRSKQYQHDVYMWINRTPQGINIAARYPNTETGDGAGARVHRRIPQVADRNGTRPAPHESSARCPSVRATTASIQAGSLTNQ